MPGYKKNSYQISIPNPCHEDWEKMIPGEKGRFCLSCKNTIVDFSKMNDEQIIASIKDNFTLCGRLSRNQLNRPISTKIYQPRIISWWQTLSFTLLSIFSSRMEAKEHENILIKSININDNSKINSNSELSKLEPNVKNNAEKHITLKGKVLDFDTKQPLIGAQLSIYSNGECVTKGITNEDGSFIFDITGFDSLSLICNYIGYDSFQIDQIKKSSDLEIDLKIPNSGIMGIIIIVGDYKYFNGMKYRVKNGTDW
jgi:hypothetical protein